MPRYHVFLRPRNDAKEEETSVDVFDPNFNAFHRSTIGTLLPFYETSMDKTDWTASVSIQWLAAIIAYKESKSSVITVNALKVTNLRQNSIKNATSAYPMKYSAKQVRQVCSRNRQLILDLILAAVIYAGQF